MAFSAESNGDELSSTIMKILGRHRHPDKIKTSQRTVFEYRKHYTLLLYCARGIGIVNNDISAFSFSLPLLLQCWPGSGGSRSPETHGCTIVGATPQRMGKSNTVIQFQNFSLRKKPQQLPPTKFQIIFVRLAYIKWLNPKYTWKKKKKKKSYRPFYLFTFISSILFFQLPIAN